MATKIYGLTSPDSGNIRYIGKTISTLPQRMQCHLYTARRGKDKSAKGKWLSKIIAQGKKPGIVLISIVPEGDSWADHEKQTIIEYRNTGHQLLNISDGGNGSHRLKGRAEIDESVIVRFGVDPDAMIAEDLGLSRKAVSYHRNKLGIPAGNSRTRNVMPPSMGGHNKINLSQKFVRIIGTVSDAKLAKMAGCSKPVIARHRRELGIVSFAERTGENGQFNGIGSHPRWGCKSTETAPPA